METPDPLSELADIHLPGEVGAWPPAFGWWILAALLLAALVLGARRGGLTLLRRRREAAALRELHECLRRYREKAAFEQARNQAGLDYLAEVNAILRRVALFHYPASEAAALSGAAWLAFLDAHGGGNAFGAGPGRALGDGVYRREFDADAEALHACAQAWIHGRYREREAKKPLRGRAVEARA